MHSLLKILNSTIGRKFLMALSGFVLVLFVMGHMLGNLQIFLGPDVINAYAYKLHSMPAALLWSIRLFLLGCIAVHIWAAVVLTIDNKKARPVVHGPKATVQASYSSRTMRMSGLILLAFIIFHIAHYTVRNIPGKEYNEKIAKVALMKQGEPVSKNGHTVMTFNVNDMMVAGFRVWWVSLFYVVAVGLLCMHLTHGVSSMFQTIGLRNKDWKNRLDQLALVYGWIVFLGFAAIPTAALSGLIKPMNDGVKNAALEMPEADVSFQKTQH
ncbi:MAG: succinate dehydrogenase cytochrome b subunit [Verrucomicrobiota bacterium]